MAKTIARAVTVERRDEFAQAWNRHDVDAKITVKNSYGKSRTA